MRGGIVHADKAIGGRPIGAADGRPRWFFEADWESKGSVDAGDRVLRAPVSASCVPLFHIPLGNVEKHISQGGGAPDTAIRWSPDSQQIAIGTFLGEVLVADGWTGEIQSRKRFAETMVKQVEWSRDGSVLYVAEQSPDGTLWALRSGDLEPIWSVALSEFVESSPLPAANIYGVYTLPGAYGLDVLEDGTLFVVATHAWNDRNGARQNRSQLLHFSKDGKLLRSWPENSADAVFYRPQVKQSMAILPVSKSSEGASDTRLPKGGALVFDIDAFSPVGTIEPPPMRPWFANTFLWEAMDRRADTVLIGLGDGRVQLWSPKGVLLRTVEAGSPILAGPIPIAAGIGEAIFHGDRLVYQTSATHIPFGAAAPELRPPTFHPNENSIFISDQAGVQQWSWTGPHALEGMMLSPDGRTLLVGAGKRTHDIRRDLYGLLIFDLGSGDADIDPQLDRFCRSEGPVFFRADATRDGRFGVAEFPIQHAQNPAEGEYRLTVFR